MKKERFSASTDPKIRKKFDAFVEQNNNEEEGSRLSREELILDKEYYDSLTLLGDKKCEEVRKELEYDSTMKDMLIDKLKKKYLSDIAVEGITLKAFKGNFLWIAFA